HEHPVFDHEDAQPARLAAFHGAPSGSSGSATREPLSCVSGISIRHCTPAGSNVSVTLAPNSYCSISAINRRPRPVRVGSFTGGPPLSTQVRVSSGCGDPAATSHVIATRPVDESAPNFTALEASS